MRRVSEVNELYGRRESLERVQRRESRFFNTCMMATALGAAVSDALADGRVVSGVARHLRDVYVSEYGITDLRGACDEDCVRAMTGIADARFQAALLRTAYSSGKVGSATPDPRALAHNTPERLRDALAPFRADGSLPDYPLGSDFTPVEQRLVKALTWLKANTATRGAKLKTIARALFAPKATSHEDIAVLTRMGYASPAGAGEAL